MNQNRSQPSTKAHSSEEHPVIGFLTRFRTPLIVAGATVIVAIVALLIVLSIQANRLEDALVAAENLEDDYDGWRSEPEDEREQAFDALREQAVQVETDHAGTYAEVRAILIQASGLAELGRWADASDEYQRAATVARDSLGDGAYLAAVALMDGAIASENAGNEEQALALYQSVVEDYGDETPEAPRAAFSVGRILESLDRIAEAADAYRAVVDDYPASSWTNMARNRIITLTVEGRIGG
jgi:tetratricopeptide (TPR) repeat protein